MSGKQALDRALIFMEFDKLSEAETALREAVRLAEEEEDVETLVGAMCCLGDYLYSVERDEEAVVWLKKVLEHRPDDDSLADEMAMAEEFLYEMGERSPE